MASSAISLCVAAMAIAVLFQGCASEPERLAWRVSFRCSADRAEATRLILSIHQGRCDALGKRVYEAKLARGDSAPVTEDLKKGQYALVAVASGSGDSEVARGCSNVDLPSDDAASVRLASAGECSAMDAGAPEGGLDAESEGDARADVQGTDGPACPGPELFCDGACIDVLSNNDRCGDCKTACPADTQCVDGACQCADGTRYCPSAGGGSGACVDISTNNDACGDCDTRCDVSGGQTCSGGSCVCAAGGRYCPNGRDGGGGCVDVFTDERFCGGCGVMCPADAQCMLGICVCDSDGLTACGGACVDTTTNGGHCGECDNPCPGEQTCVASVCACPDRNMAFCGTSCIDVASDNGNCGECGHECQSGSTCQSGICRPDSAPNSCDSLRHGGHDYLLCTQTMSWSAARNACQQFGIGWDLAIIDDSAENSAIETKAQETDPDQGWWAGGWDGAEPCSGSMCDCQLNGATFGSNTDVEGEWYWVNPGDGAETSSNKTGRPLCTKATDDGACVPEGTSYMNWRSGRPNNVGSCSSCACDGSDEDCLYIVPANGWDDDDCARARRFVCESS